MKYLSKHMHENDMWFSYQSHSRITIFYDSDSNSIQLGLIPILISVLSPIPGFTKIHDSDSNSDSSSKWFRFQQTRLWFRFWFQNLIPIPESFTTLELSYMRHIV